MVTFPLGLTFRDAVRVGVRFAASDDFEGWRYGNPLDLVTYLSVGYRWGSPAESPCVTASDVSPQEFTKRSLRA